MTTWKLRECDLKRYPHFDQILKAADAEALVKNPERVAKNPFFPFVQYVKAWQPFRHPPKETKKERPEKEAKKRPEKKTRKIRYAARRDAYIFAYYRHLLSELYEAELVRLGISHCPIAYRRISRHKEGGSGKCNIQFAHEAFLKIRELGNCCAIAVDISKYFETIDHERLKTLWCRLLCMDKLPPDHFAVFKNITKYRYVDKIGVYRRLGYFGPKKTTKSGKIIDGYLIPYNDVPLQLCSLSDFRKKIVGDKNSTLIEKNDEKYGIPQGAPISDLLANLYLIDFDVEMNNLATKLGGSYLRYSDDILFVLPVSVEQAKEIMDSLPEWIKQHGEKLEIKPSKSFLVRYTQQGDRQVAANLDSRRKTNGLEYLGFRYDGKDVYLRDATVSNLYRKVAYAARSQARTIVKLHPGKGYNELCRLFNFEEFHKKFGRVEDFETKSSKKDWTFWTYARRASEEFGPLGLRIAKQISRIKKVSKHRVYTQIAFALERKEKEGID